MSICFDLVKILLLFEYKKAYLLLQYIWSSLSIPFTICTQNDKVLQPNVLLGCLITCYKFCSHGGGSFNSLLGIAPSSNT